MLGTVVVGIGGAVIGGLLLRAVAPDAVLQFDVRSILVAALGAVLLMAGYRLYTRRFV